MFTVGVLGALAALLAACGSSSASTTTTSSAAGGRSVTSSGGGSPRQFPGASGTIAAVNGPSIEVQNTSTGQTTVSYTSATTFRQIVSTNAAAVTVGSCISAFGKPTSGSSSTTGAFGVPITATSVTVSQPVSGSCSVGFGRVASGGAPPSGGAPQGGTTSGSRSVPSGARRFRGNGQFGAASGSVTAVGSGSITVSETNPRTEATSSVVVTLTSTTTFTTTQTASASALVVGQCAHAVGSASSTGSITATSITVSSPGANGCSTGFGGFGRPPGGAAPTGA